MSSHAATALKFKLKEAAVTTCKLLQQAKQVVAGNRIIPKRMVSFFDPDARPIKKGKLGKTAEFGYKVRIDSRVRQSRQRKALGVSRCKACQPAKAWQERQETSGAREATMVSESAKVSCCE